MLQTQPQPRARQRPSATYADRRFKGYKPEKEEAVRTPKVVEDETLKQLRDTFVRWIEAEEGMGGFEKLLNKTHQTYDRASEIVEDLVYSAEDIKNFCIALAEFQDQGHFGYNAGLFLSVLINNCVDTDFVIPTQHLSRTIDHLGYGNTKNLVVEGNVGRCVGLSMEKGSIIVKGNAKDSVGFKLRGGTIVIERDAENKIGFGMHSGTILIKGNAGDLLGLDMKGGEIHLEGKHQGLVASRFIKGGRIFHKGVQIYPTPESEN